jgi:hypothetical protein
MVRYYLFRTELTSATLTRLLPALSLSFLSPINCGANCAVTISTEGSWHLAAEFLSSLVDGDPGMG